MWSDRTLSLWERVASFARRVRARRGDCWVTQRPRGACGSAGGDGDVSGTSMAAVYDLWTGERSARAVHRAAAVPNPHPAAAQPTSPKGRGGGNFPPFGKPCFGPASIDDRMLMHGES
jgi:hypothetical protein